MNSPWFLLIFITCSVGFTAELKILAVPPARRLVWNNDLSVIRSFLKSQAHALFQKSLADTQRRTLGHVMAVITCDNVTRWTSISINPARSISPLLRDGVTGLFNPSPHAYMQSESEIKGFIETNQSVARELVLNISNQSCLELIAFDNFHRSSNLLFFGPLIAPLTEYEKARHGISAQVGGTGASYAVALLKMADFKLPFDAYKENFGNYSFYTAQGIVDHIYP